MKTDTFSGFHPAVNLCFFAAVIGITMFLMHPVFLSISFLCACGYLWYLRGGRRLVRQIGFLLPVLLFTAALNPLFNPDGATVLFLLPGGSPVTWEAVCFGLTSAALMGASIIWFSCCSIVITTDKIIYLFGRLIPSLSLLISMTLRFVPRFKDYLQSTVGVLRAMEPPKTRLMTLKQALTAFSATVSWAMEQSIVTADSMKSRGYGCAGRSAYAICRFERRDALAIALMAVLSLGTVLPWAAGCVRWSFFPAINAEPLDFGAMLCYLSFSGICMMPLMIDWKEDRKWSSLRSKI